MLRAFIAPWTREITGNETIITRAPAAGSDAIVEAVLAAEFSLDDEKGLTTLIVEGVKSFERDVVEYLNRVE